jgi:phage-related protein
VILVRYGVGEEHLKRIPAAFYQSDTGSEPVREWLRSLPAEDRRILGYDIGVVEFGWPIGMPVCRSLGDGLWEVRSSLSGGRIARVLFCIAEGQMVLLHGFIKKSQKTPAPDLALARRRQKEVEQ